MSRLKTLEAGFYPELLPDYGGKAEDIINAAKAWTSLRTNQEILENVRRRERRDMQRRSGGPKLVSSDVRYELREIHKSPFQKQVMQKLQKLQKNSNAKQLLFERVQQAKKSRPLSPRLNSERDILLENMWLCDDVEKCRTYWEDVQKMKKTKDAEQISSALVVSSKHMPKPPGETHSHSKMLAKIGNRSRKLRAKLHQAKERRKRLEKERLLFFREKKTLAQRKRKECLRSAIIKVVVYVRCGKVLLELLEDMRMRNRDNEMIFLAALRIQKQWKRAKSSEEGVKYRNAVEVVRKFASIAVKNRRKNKEQRAARIISWFLSSFEKSNFQTIMRNYRSKVVNCQRLYNDYVEISRTRLRALGVLWDRVEKEKLRHERQHALEVVRRREMHMQECSRTSKYFERSKRAVSPSATLAKAVDLGIKMFQRVPKDVKKQILRNHLKDVRRDFKRRWIEFVKSRKFLQTQSRFVSVEDVRRVLHADTDGELSMLLEKKSAEPRDSARMAPMMLLFSKSSGEHMSELIDRARQIVDEKVVNAFSVG